METIIFYILSFLILTFSVLTVSSNKILRSAVYLLFTLIATAAFYFMMDYTFLAAVQLTVYAGGIVVLIIFSILLTHQINFDLEKPTLRKKLLSALIIISGSVLIGIHVLEHYFTPTSSSISDNSVNEIGRTLLSYSKDGYVLPFEVISILLLAAMIGAIVIAKKK